MSALSFSEIRTAWEHRLQACRDLRANVDGVHFCELVLADLAALRAESQVASVTLQEAALAGGYSVDHLQRMVATGTIENVGRKGAPRVRRGDVPTKPGHSSGGLPSHVSSDQLSARRRIVADAQAHRGA